jgi:hypothetical protein
MSVTITKSFDLSEFRPWSGGYETLEVIKARGLMGEFEALLSDLYAGDSGNGNASIDEVDLNDLLWHDREWVFESLNVYDYDRDDDEEGEEDQDDDE